MKYTRLGSSLALDYERTREREKPGVLRLQDAERGNRARNFQLETSLAEFDKQ